MLNHVTPVAGPTVLKRENDGRWSFLDRLGAIPASSYNPYPPVNIDMEHPPWKIHVPRKPCFVFPYPIVKCYADLKIVICSGELIFQPHSRGSMSFHWGMFLKKKHWRGHPPFSSQRWNVAPLSCCATGGLQTAQRLQARNQKLGQWIFETGIRGCQQKRNTRGSNMPNQSWKLGTWGCLLYETTCSVVLTNRNLRASPVVYLVDLSCPGH